MDDTGYANLVRLCSWIYTKKQSNIDDVLLQPAWLTQHSHGLIALSGCHKGELATCLADKQMADACVQKWQALFGDRWYIELQRVGRANEEQYISEALATAQRMDCAVVATNDVRFLRKEDYHSHCIRECIANKWLIEEVATRTRYTPQQYLRSSAEMAELFADIPEAIENAIQIGYRCNIASPLRKPAIPKAHFIGDANADTYLYEKAHRQLLQRLTSIGVDTNDAQLWQRYQERLDFELGVIAEKQFSEYFLIVEHILAWAREQGIAVGAGRGSGAGSLVAYALYIVAVDPLKHGLMFERFLNMGRDSLPDFDIDFCVVRREEIIRYISTAFGKPVWHRLPHSIP